MNEVKYSINGKYFADYGVYVSESNGIGDVLKRKPIRTYDWAEYNGVSVDLSNPRFEAREIELRCFIHADNWEELYENFNTMIRDEFSKSGTQRLLIEVFDETVLPYEVFLADGVEIDKTFRDGEMVATFTLNLVEPNPIKKVLYLAETSLNLAYNSTSETEIFYGNGTKDVVQGNASIVGKTLPSKSYIIIAGDIKGISNLTTNATVIWAEL